MIETEGRFKGHISSRDLFVCYKSLVNGSRRVESSFSLAETLALLGICSNKRYSSVAEHLVLFLLGLGLFGFH